MVRGLIAIAFSTVTLIATGCSDAQNSNIATNNGNKARANATIPSPLPSATIDELASGREIYSTSCVNCHKESGTGGKVTIEGKEIKAEDLTSAKVKAFPDEKILRVIMNGAEDEGMPAFKGRISEAQMRDVLKFIRVELQKMPANGTPNG
ncbi:MAG: hypothetical protein DMF63_13300 [Acidobacteria bacterium]|nr:MAG: hypothetical protein DMF63_13300 [Acidobacteriota bacterium]